MTSPVKTYCMTGAGGPRSNQTYLKDANESDELNHHYLFKPVGDIFQKVEAKNISMTFDLREHFMEARIWHRHERSPYRKPLGSGLTRCWPKPLPVASSGSACSMRSSRRE